MPSVTKSPRPIPAISDEQIGWLLEEADVTLEMLHEMLQEIPAAHHGYGAVDIARAIISAGREGVPKLGKSGNAFIDLVISWEPWDWEKAEE